MAEIITLTTDFGLSDAYVGSMKGVILGIAPSARIADISHQVAPQDVPGGAFLLLSAYRYFPPDSVHVAVVDPGVGTSRRPIAARTPHGIFVAPDNGLIAPILADQGILDLASGAVPTCSVVELADPRFRLPNPSGTFHGRDIFAPAAAHLSLGVPLESLGPAVATIQTAELPLVETLTYGLEGEIIRVDHFGNAISNIPAARLGSGATVQVDGREIGPLSRTYQDAPVVALEGSTGFVEIAVRNGSAARQLGLKVGDRVRVLMQ